MHTVVKPKFSKANRATGFCFKTQVHNSLRRTLGMRLELREWGARQRCEKYRLPRENPHEVTFAIRRDGDNDADVLPVAEVSYPHSETPGAT